MANNDEILDRFSSLEIDDTPCTPKELDPEEEARVLEIPGFEPDLLAEVVNNSQKVTWERVQAALDNGYEHLITVSDEIRQLVSNLIKWQFEKDFKGGENMDLEDVLWNVYYLGAGGFFENLEGVEDKSRCETVLLKILEEPRLAAKTAIALCGLCEEYMCDFRRLIEVNPEVLISVYELVRRFENKNKLSETLDMDEPIFGHVFTKELVDLYAQMDPTIMQRLIATLVDKFSELSK